MSKPGSSITFVASYVLLYLVYFSSADDGPANSTTRKPIRGQQFTTQTTVAKFEGGPVPEDLLKFLAGSEDPPAKHSFAPPPDDAILPHLIVDNVKTVVTRLTIPLAKEFTDSERYRNILKQFLTENQINMTKKDPLENPTGDFPDASLLIHHLYLASIFRTNLVSSLAHILYRSDQMLPAHHHEPIAHIYDLLRLNRLPVIDLLDSLDKLWAATPQQQWILVLSELEKHMPEYMKSCATFLLESLLNLSLNIEDISHGSRLSLLTNLPKLSSVIRFPKEVLSKVKTEHEKILGRTMSVMLTYFINYHQNWSPQLLALWLQHFSRNVPTPLVDEVALQMIITKPSQKEFTAVRNACRKFIKNDQDIYVIFRNILADISQEDFAGQEKYAILLQNYESPSETYVIRNFEQMQPLMINQSISKLLEAAIPFDAPMSVILAKENVSSLLLEKNKFLHIFSRYSAESPTQLMQMVLFRARILNDTRFQHERILLESYLNKLARKTRGF